MEIRFKKIRVQNFMSIGEAELLLSNRGIVQIIGQNRSEGSALSNGSGKSALIGESIYYGMTGETLRGSRDVENRFRDGKMEIELEYEVIIGIESTSYRILRWRKEGDKGLRIWKGGEEISGDKLKKSEEILGEELRLRVGALSGIMLMGQSAERFTELKPKERKERLEELSQSAGFIVELTRRIEEGIKSGKKRFNEIEKKKTETETKIEMLKIQRSQAASRLMELYRETELGITEEEKKEMEEKIEEGKRKKKEKEMKEKEMSIIVQGYRMRAEEKEKEMKELSGQIYLSGEKIKGISKLVDELERRWKRVQERRCPECGQWIESPERVEEMRGAIEKEREEKIRELEKEGNAKREKEEIKNKKENELKELVDRKNERESILEKEIKALKDEMDELRSRVIEIKIKSEARKESKEREIEELTKRVEELGKEENGHRMVLMGLVGEVNREEMRLGILEWIKKMSVKDFRGYLLSGVVDYMNRRLNYFSEALYGTRLLKMNLEGTKIFITYDGREYESLSGGEQRLADLAVQFSLRDLLKRAAGFSTNIQVLDEVFENVDQKGVENIIKLVNSFTDSESIFVISHTYLDMPHDSEIRVIKGVDKVTYIEEVV